VAEANNNKPKTFLRILKSSPDLNLPEGSMVEVKIKDGVAKVISEPMPFPKDKVVTKK
jgi:hypothetical protein